MTKHYYTNMKTKIEAKTQAAEIYGEIPPKPTHLTLKIEYVDANFAASKARLSNHNILLEIEDKKIPFQVISVIPSSNVKHPAIIFLNSENGIPNKYLPIEELIDRGYAIFSVKMDDVAEPNGNFKAKICGHIARSRRKKSSAGKIAVWAWTILRTLDLVCDLDEINKDFIALAGHGVGARAAMLAAGYDERAGFVIANCIRTYPTTYSEKYPKSSATVRDFPYLYCPAFVENPIGDEYSTLLKLCSSKRVMIGCAEDGDCFDEKIEYSYLSALKSTCEDRKIPATSESNRSGEISYHNRPGSDYFSRGDWNIYLDFIDEKLRESLEFDN